MEKENEIGNALRSTNKDMKLFLDRYMSQHSPNSLTRVEGQIICYISHHESVYATDIMANFHLQKATVSEAISKLEKKGHVKIVSDKHDKRKKIIVLTPIGEKAKEEFDVLYQSLIPTIEKGIDEEDKEVFLRVCNQIKKNVGGEYEQN